MEKKNGTIEANVQRFDPSKDREPRFQTYQVPFVEGMSVLNVMNYIFENMDSSLSYYFSCRIGRCTGCDILINGEVKFPCTTLAEGNMKLEPLPDFVVVKDLFVDKSRRKEAPREKARLFGR